MTATPPVKKKFNVVLVLVPIAVISALVFAVVWPPSHKLLAAGPLKRVVDLFGHTKADAQNGPPSAAANPEVKRLNDALEADRKVQLDKDARITALQSQLDQAQAAPKRTAAPRDKHAAAGANADSAAAPGAPADAPVPQDIKRTAQYWAAMDADKAADIAQKLPTGYVNHVFAAMPPDSVGEIMNVLPPAVAARFIANATPPPAVK